MVVLLLYKSIAKKWHILHIQNILAITLFCFIFIHTTTKQAISQNAFTSAVVANIDSGESLYAYQIDKRIHPASLTKIMTAYIVFDAISSGSVGLYDKVDLTQYADIGLPSIFSYQETVTIQELLVKLAVNSCNECAVALAIEVANNFSYVYLTDNFTGQGSHSFAVDLALYRALWDLLWNSIVHNLTAEPLSYCSRPKKITFRQQLLGHGKL